MSKSSVFTALPVTNSRTLWLPLVGFLFPFSTLACVAEDLEFFEAKIRPLLVEHCYRCHNSTDSAEGGLAVDCRDAIRTESASATAVVPGQPERSLLLKVMRHEIADLEMPKGGAKLSAAVVADVELWISSGAIDPRDTPPNAAELAEATSWQTTLAKRKQWWCFQPLQPPGVPPESAWSKDPIDRFIFQKLSASGLDPAKPASRLALLRRLSYTLTGLPPTQDQIDEFLRDEHPLPFENWVDRFLASPHFGERWARHWMDWVRYADSHGSEGDPKIPNAYQYRDYLIRALNDDVPYDQLLREHIAGDLLETPRINHELGVNESAIGTAHWRLVFHGFAPTDALDEKVRFTDDQINVIGKAFQGLTISCARCHDHKFDPISQADYYALFGVLGSCRPTTQDVNTMPRQNQNKSRLRDLKDRLRAAVAEDWLANTDQIAHRLEKLEAAADSDAVGPVVTMWLEVQQALQAGRSFRETWKERTNSWNKHRSGPSEKEKGEQIAAWNLGSSDDYAEWFAMGNGLDSQPANAGEFTVSLNEDDIIAAIFPACVLTHRLSTLHRGFLGSPRIELSGKYEAWMELIGGGGASARYVVQNYPRNGTVYPIHTIGQASWYWQKFDLGYWKGDQIHLELATGKDAPLQVSDKDRSWFAVRQVYLREKGTAVPLRINAETQCATPIYEAAEEINPNSIDELSQCYQLAIVRSIEAWKEGRATDEDALLLNACLQGRLLTNTAAEGSAAKTVLQSYRALESQTPIPTRVPGLAEADAFDQPLFERGNHHRPLEPVKRRFLEAIDATPFESSQSGRFELAQALTSRENPLTARVIVNRIWHYLFGQGIVATPDNFGKLGQQPTHPELLDYLATQMVENRWSIKRTIRQIVLAKTWQQSANSSAKAAQLDPENRLLSHFSIRRLDAESIRDSLIFAAGALDETMYGPGFSANSNSKRRSLYVRSARNSMDAFLAVFDSPVPFSTTGRRNETNVPAQSLTLMNDPFVVDLARQIASEIKRDTAIRNDTERLASLFQRVLGRPPSAKETSSLLKYLSTTRQLLAGRKDLGSSLPAEEPWTRVAHALFNLKEFIYLQ